MRIFEPYGGVKLCKRNIKSQIYLSLKANFKRYKTSQFTLLTSELVNVSTQLTYQHN